MVLQTRIRYSSMGITAEEMVDAISTLTKEGFSAKDVSIRLSNLCVIRFKDLCVIRFKDGTERNLTFQEHHDWYNTYDYDPGDCKNLKEFEDKLMVAEL